jgi:hypothetical protein
MKTAIFYDLENLGLPIRNGEFEGAFTGLLERIRPGALIGGIVLQRAYMSKANSALAHIQPVLQKLGVELVAVEPFSDSPGKKKSNLVDFKMVVDAVATIARKRGITTVAIASGDNDFGFLCQKIKEMGKRLVVISRLGITGEAMLRLCDDWVSSDGQALPPKYIPKIIDARITTDYSAGSDFFSSLNDFLVKLESDHFVCRCMAETGLPAPVFIELLRRRGLAFPDYGKLGFVNITAFVTTLLRGASFRLVAGSILYTPDRQPPSAIRLASNLLNIPPDYSREKLLRYYDVIEGVGNTDELIAYIGFMKRSGMLTANGLCPKRTFRAAIRNHLGRVLSAAGITLDKKTMAELEKKL